MARRPSIAPGSVACRIRSACPAGVGATMGQIIAQALARPEDVRAEVDRLRRAGYLRVYAGKTRARRYFWRP